MSEDYTRKVRRCAIVVFCEAEGVDEQDAAAAAQYALSNLIRTHGLEGVELESVSEPTCSVCGVDQLRLTKKGNITSHASCERFVARRRVDRCVGSGKLPRVPNEPIIGYTARSGLALHARVHQVMEAGMALGNGYLWAKTTRKGFR